MEIIEPKPPLLDPEPEPHPDFQHDKTIYTVQTCCGYHHSKEISTYIAGLWVVALCLNFARSIYELKNSKDHRTIDLLQLLVVVLMTATVAAFFMGVKKNSKSLILPFIVLHVTMFLVYILKVFFLIMVIINPKHFFADILREYYEQYTSSPIHDNKSLRNSSFVLILILLALEVVNFYFFYVLQKYYRYLYDLKIYQKRIAKEFGTDHY